MRTPKVLVVLYFVYVNTVLMTTSQESTPATETSPQVLPLKDPKHSYSLVKMVPGVIELTTSSPTTIKQDASNDEGVTDAHTQKTNDNKMSVLNETFPEIKSILQRELKVTTKEKPSTSMETNSTTEIWLLPVFVNDPTNASLTKTTELDFLESLEEILNYSYEDLTYSPLIHENDKRNHPVTENANMNTSLKLESTLLVQHTPYTEVSFPVEELYAHTSPTEQYKLKTSNSNTFVPVTQGEDNTNGTTTEIFEVRLVYGDKTKKATQNSMTIFPIHSRVYLEDFSSEKTGPTSDETKKPTISIIEVGKDKRSTNPISILTSQDDYEDFTVPITLHKEPKTVASQDSLVQRRAYFGGVYPLEEITHRSDKKKKPTLFAVKDSIGKRLTNSTSFLNSQEDYEDYTATITQRKELKTTVSIHDSLKIYPIERKLNFERNFPKQLPKSDKTTTTLSAINDSKGKSKNSDLFLNSQDDNNINDDSTGRNTLHKQPKKTFSTQDALKIFPIQRRVYFGGVFPLEETTPTSPIFKTNAPTIQDKNVIIKVPLSVLRSLKDILPPRVVESIPNSTPTGLNKNAFRFYKTVKVMTVPNIDYEDQDEYKRVTITLQVEDLTQTQSTSPLTTTEELNSMRPTVISDITVPDNTDSDSTESTHPTFRMINNSTTPGQVHRVLSEMLRKYSIIKLPSLNSASKNIWTINKNTSVTGHVDKVLSKILNKYPTETVPHKLVSEPAKSFEKLKNLKFRNNIFKSSYRTTTPEDLDIITLQNNIYSNGVMRNMPYYSTNAPGILFSSEKLPRPLKDSEGKIPKPSNDHNNEKQYVHQTSYDSHNLFSTQLERNKTPFTKSDTVIKKYTIPIVNTDGTQPDSLYVPIYNTLSTPVEGLGGHITEKVYETSTESNDLFIYRAYSTTLEGPRRHFHKPSNHYHNHEAPVYRTSTDSDDVYFDTTYSTPLEGKRRNLYKSSKNYRYHKEPVNTTSTESYNALFSTIFSTPKQYPRGNIYKSSNNDLNNEKSVYRTSTKSHNAFFDTTFSTPKPVSSENIYKSPNNYRNNEEIVHRTSTKSHNLFFDTTLSTPLLDRNGNIYKPPKKYHNNAESVFTSTESYDVFFDRTLEPNESASTAYDAHVKRTYTIPIQYNMDKTPMSLKHLKEMHFMDSYRKKEPSVFRKYLVFLNSTLLNGNLFMSSKDYHNNKESLFRKYLVFLNSSHTTPLNHSDVILSMASNDYHSKKESGHKIHLIFLNNTYSGHAEPSYRTHTTTVVFYDDTDKTRFGYLDRMLHIANKAAFYTTPATQPEHRPERTLTTTQDIEYSNNYTDILKHIDRMRTLDKILSAIQNSSANYNCSTGTAHQNSTLFINELSDSKYSTQEYPMSTIFPSFDRKVNKNHRTQSKYMKLLKSQLISVQNPNNLAYYNITLQNQFERMNQTFPNYNRPNITSATQVEHPKSILYSTLAAQLNSAHTTQAIKRAPSSDLVELYTTPFSLFKTSFDNKSSMQLEHYTSILYPTLTAQLNSAHTTQAIKIAPSSDLVELYTTPFSLFKTSFNNTFSNQLGHSKSLLYSTLATKFNSAHTTQAIKRAPSSELVESSTTPFSLFKTSFNNTSSTQLEHFKSPLYSKLATSSNNAHLSQDVIYSKRAPSSDRTKSFTTPFSLFKASLKNTSSKHLEHVKNTSYSTFAAKVYNAYTTQTSSDRVQSYTTPITSLDAGFSSSSSTQLEKVKSIVYSTIAAKVNNAHTNQALSLDDIQLHTTHSTPFGRAFNNSSPTQLEYPEITLYLSPVAKVNSAHTTQAIKRAPSSDYIQSDTTSFTPLNALFNSTSSTQLGNLKSTLYSTLAFKVNNAHITQAIKRVPSSDLIESYTTPSTLLNRFFSNTSPRKLENSRSTVYSKLAAKVNNAHTTQDMIYSKRAPTSDHIQKFTTPSTPLHASIITSPTKLRNSKSTLYSTLAAKVDNARTTLRSDPSQPYITPSLLNTIFSSMTSTQSEKIKSTVYSTLDAQVNNSHTTQDKRAPTSDHVEPSVMPTTQTEYQNILNTTRYMYFNSTYTTSTPLPTKTPYVLQDALSNTTHKTKSSFHNCTGAAILNSTVAILQEDSYSTEPVLKGEPNSIISVIKGRNRTVASFQIDSNITELENSNLLYTTHAIKYSTVATLKEYRNSTVATLRKDSNSTVATLRKDSNSTVATIQHDSSTLQTLVNLYEDEESRKRNVQMLHSTPEILPYKKHRKTGLPLTEAEFIREMLPQTKYANNTCGIDKSPVSVVYEGVGRIETYPWLGMLFFPKGKQWASTSVVLVTKNTVIGFALDIDALSKSKFRQRARVALGNTCNKQRLRVLDYNYHPEYRSGTYSALVLVQLDLASVQQELRPICAPPKRLTESVIHAMILSEDCKNSKMKIYEMTHVPRNECKNYYRKYGMDIGSIWPKHAACGKARWGGHCVWRSGTALVVRQNGRWHLLGFGVHGPGCEAPARFVDYGMYRRWVVDSVARIGRPAVTRLGPNHLVLRRMTTHIQRFGPCDADETQYEMFTDKTTVAPSSLARHAGRVRYNLTIFANIDYSCVVFRAFHTHKRWQGTKPLVSLRRYCPSKMPICYSTDMSQIQFYMEIVYFHGITYKVAAYGREARVIDPKSLTRYANLKKMFAVIPWPSTEMPNER